MQEGQIANLLAAFDISFEDANGQTVSYQDNFTVTLLIPENLRSKTNLKVIHIADNGAIEDMEATRDGNYMVFDTTHFSVYAIVEVADENPQTPPVVDDHDHLIFWICIGVEALLIITLFILYFSRKKETEVVEEAPVEEVVEEAPVEETPVEEIVVPVVEESVEQQIVYLVSTPEGVKEMTLLPQAEDDIISKSDVEYFAIGQLAQDKVSLYKKPLAVKFSVGKNNGETVSLYKKPVAVLASVEEKSEEIVELGVVIEEEDKIIVRVYKNSKDVIVLKKK